jgi:hypothetical protein
MELKETPHTKMARVLVEEINSIDRIGTILALETRIVDMDPGMAAAIGFGCGGGCPGPVGFGCGGGCTIDIKDWNPDLIRERYAIDVLGKRGLAERDMAAMRDLPKMQAAIHKVIEEKLNINNMRIRMEK